MSFSGLNISSQDQGDSAEPALFTVKLST